MALVFGPRARAVWRLALVLALAALAALALSGVIELQSGALTMLPALALAVVMLTRPYVGERVIARLRARRRGARTSRAASSAAPRRRRRAWRAAGV